MYSSLNEISRQSSAAEPEIYFRTCKAMPDARYYLSLPAAFNEKTPVLVAIHGISRNAREQAVTFARICDALGWAVVAPLFTAKQFPKYQRLGYKRRRGLPRSDQALDAILDEVAALTGADTGKVYMFGYSGGGQFAHRYGFLNPHRVISMALGSPGWFTFPEVEVPYPRGLMVNGGEDDFDLDWETALRIPTAVFVGSCDVERDRSLNTAKKIDDQQGRTRPERGRRWIAAMKEAARSRGLSTWFEYFGLEGCGHSFSECVADGRMDRGVTGFLLAAAENRSG